MDKKIVDTNPQISVGGNSWRYWIGRTVKTKYSDKADYTKNLNLTEILEKYKLAGFEFGNWLSNNERYDHVLAAQRALKMLAWVMGAENLGFDYHVGIAFGARGKGKALAHYEPGFNIINLTKMKGSASLAHEYGHALDFNFGTYIDQSKDFLCLTKGTGLGEFRYYARQCVDQIKKTDSYKNRCPEGEYWHRPEEIFARGFEQFVAKRLVQGYNEMKIHKKQDVKPLSY